MKINHRTGDFAVGREMITL